MVRFAAILSAILFLCLGADLALAQTKGPSQLPTTDQAQPDAGAAQPDAGTADQPQPDAGSDQTQPDAGDSDDQAPPATEGDDTDGSDQGMPNDNSNGEAPGDDMSLAEIPDIKTVELTSDIAKKALDVFVLVRDKYADANLEDYDNLQDFVDQTEQGKQFDVDVKAAGFSDVNAWNTAITSVSYAYGSLTDDQTADIKSQIEDIKNDKTIAQDMKDRAITSLNNMIPSENNKKVVQALINDSAYGEKLKLLDEGAE